MKLSKKQLKSLKTIYLYPDKHAILKHEESRGNLRTEWVEIVKEFIPEVYFYGNKVNQERGQERTTDARLIFSGFYDFQNHGLANILAQATKLEVFQPKQSSADSKLKSLGISSGYLNIYTKDGMINLYELPTLLAGDYTSQFESKYSEKYEDLKGKYSWSNYQIINPIQGE